MALQRTPEITPGIILLGKVVSIDEKIDNQNRRYWDVTVTVGSETEVAKLYEKAIDGLHARYVFPKTKDTTADLAKLLNEDIDVSYNEQGYLNVVIGRNIKKTTNVVSSQNYQF